MKLADPMATGALQIALGRARFVARSLPLLFGRLAARPLPPDQRQRLVERTTAVLSRLQDGTLTEADTIPIGDVRFPDFQPNLDLWYRDRRLYKWRRPELIEAFDIFRVFTDQGSVVLDVGAHWGSSAIGMRHNGCRAKIVSYDVMPSSVRVLERLKQIEGAQFDCINIAVGRTRGTLRLYLPTMNGHGITALASTGGTLQAYYAEQIADQAVTFRKAAWQAEDGFRLAILDVPSDSLDNTLESRGDTASRVVAIKMDLEGHEGPALLGAESLLKSAKPLLMIEGANRDPQVVNVMAGHGYVHTVRASSRLVRHDAMSDANDGIWIHPSRFAEYYRLGLLTGPQP